MVLQWGKKRLIKKIASLVGPAPGTWKGEAYIYQVAPPVSYTDYSGNSHNTDFVVASSVDFWGRSLNYGFAYETAIFPGRSDGEPLSMMELAAVNSDLDPIQVAEVFEHIGYTIADQST